MIESPLGRADGVEHEFKAMPSSVVKQIPHAQPDRVSAVSMAKEIFGFDSPKEKTQKIYTDVDRRKHTFDLGAQVAYYRYEEPGVMKMHGPMEGYHLNYAYRPADPNFFNNFLTNVYMLQARFASSRDLEYSGSGIIKGKHDEVYEFRGLIGKDYFVGKDSIITPYFGFGYRYLIDHGNGQVSDQFYYGYDRKSHYYYIPLGVDTIIKMPHDWAVSPNVEYDIFISGRQKSFLSDGGQFTGYSNPDIVNHQDTGYGIRASIKFIKFAHLADFYVEPYVYYWDIDQSKLAAASVDGTFSNSWNEPKNNSLELGSRFGVIF